MAFTYASRSVMQCHPRPPRACRRIMQAACIWPRLLHKPLCATEMHACALMLMLNPAVKTTKTYNRLSLLFFFWNHLKLSMRTYNETNGGKSGKCVIITEAPADYSPKQRTSG